ncbi:MAG: HNH endonuclease signature motif containing protein [Nitrospirota bacterium]
MGIYPGIFVPDRVRAALLKRHLTLYGAWCPKCGQEVLASELQVDHVTPVAKGGPNALRNLEVICRSCNQQKGPSVTDIFLGLGRNG